ncbi:MAG: oligosaccharide flippase family protein [Bacteroides sp.]|nr:oligosaccharide flippase family protein [Bacteroides sp.]
MNIHTIKSNPLVRRIVHGSFWNLFGNTFSKAIVLLSSIIVAHIIGKNQYGEYSIIRTTIFMFIALASVGVGATSTKYIAEYRDTNPQKAYIVYKVTSLFSILFGIIVTIVVIYSSDYIAIRQLNTPNLSIVLKYGAILLFFCTINGAQAGALAGFEGFKEIAKNSLISSIIELIAIVILTVYFGLIGAIIGSGVSYVILALFNHICIRKYFTLHSCNRSSKLKLSDFRVILDFGLPAALCNLIVIYALWYTRTYLVRYSGFGDIAIYNAADQVKSFILFIPTALAQIILPILTNLKANGSKNSYIKVLYSNIILNILIASVLSLIICLLSPLILSLWGKDFIEPLPLILLSISTIFTAFATVVGQAIASHGKMWIGFICNLIWALLVVILSIKFINHGMGATGLALSILIAYFLHGLYQFVYLKYLLKTRI